jgi:hypothetical protein
VLSVAFIATLLALVLLAVIRGNLLMQKLKSEATETVTIDNDTPAVPEQNTFYEDSSTLLRITLALLAIGMDLGAGLVLHDARRLNARSTESREELSNEWNSVNQKIIVKVFDVTSLMSEPITFEKGFWRDFYGAMLTRTMRSAMTKLFIIGFSFTLLLSSRVFAQESTNMVILVDLSRSVAVHGQQGDSPCKENFKAVGRVLENVPAGTKITILGITADSFGDPDILLSASVNTNPGYFGEKLTNARQRLEQTWQKRSEQLECDAGATDILGALLIASEIFKEKPAPHSELIIFSDMRQNAKELSLEDETLMSSNKILINLAGKHLTADLRGASVNILGADNINNDLERWNEIEEFWKQYFKIACAEVREYSVMR